MVHHKPYSGWIVRAVLLVVAFSVLLGTVACDSEEESTEPVIADYGSYGASYARKLSLDQPLRGPFSAEEKEAAEIIAVGWANLGYKPVTDSFTVTTEQGAVLTSQNVSITLPGTGFKITNAATGEVRQVRRQVIIGAHYDTFFTRPSPDGAEPVAGASLAASTAALEAGYDGINDNSSGIGVLMLLAREMAAQSYGYDVVMVAFGAGTAGQAGSRHLAEQMSAAEVAATDAMYCIEAIYAGDKLYASAGLNSIGADPAGQAVKIYEKRRKLYEATDVSIENDLASIGYDLLTNQSALDIDLNGDGVVDIYREVTMKISDFSPFDAAGIPCVYIESYDYSFPTLEEMKDSKNPGMAPFGGQVRSSPYDSYSFLNSILSKGDQLQQRVNITTFLLLEAVKKGNWEAEP